MDKVWAECHQRMWDHNITPSRRNVYETLFAMREELRDLGRDHVTKEQHEMWMHLNILIPEIQNIGIYGHD